MTRRLSFALILPVVALLAASVSARPAQAPQGVFTQEQAARGALVYERSCAACHGAALSGDAAPPLVGPAFQASWSHPDMTLDDLFFIVRTTMPPNASSSVTLEEHADVVAYILERNGYAAGATPLAVGAPALEQPFSWAGSFRSTFGAGELANRAPADAFITGAPDATPDPITGPGQAALNDAARSTEWLMNAHDYSGTRHSPLNEINADNASRIAPVCLFQVAETDNFQTVPLVHDGVMYLTTRFATMAIDAATCRPRWKHTWQPRGDTLWERNRGVALKDGYAVRGTPDGYLLALNAATGALVWARHVASTADGETFTMAPVIYEDMVIIGPAGSENNIQGWVGAFRLSDGSPVWRFNTVPKPGEPGYETWEGPPGLPVGGGAVWTTFAIDPDTGDLHAAATNPAPDLPVEIRRGENLYTNSIVVVDVQTGALRWHFQATPNDSHDWDLTHATPLFTTDVGGAPKRLAVAVGKDGILRTLDRATRQVLYETPVTTIKNADVPVTTTPTHACPGVLGGVEWSGPSFSPVTNMLYVNAVDWCATFTAFDDIRHIPGKLYMGGTTDLDPPEQSQGWLTAIDAATGEVRWRYRSPRPMVAGVTTTGGHLTLTGELDGDFVVFDSRNGDELYRFNTGGSMGGGVITYAVDGRQFIAVGSGSPSGFWVDEFPGAPTIVVFSLPRQASDGR